MKFHWWTLICIGLLVGAYASFVALSNVGRTQGYEPEQPIPFSHKIHAGQNQIQCLYCHFAAEKGRHASVPPTALCMNCHSHIKKDSPLIAQVKDYISKQETIPWVRIHQLPDHAYFNHAQHVRLGKVSCQQCHGNIETMSRVRQEKPLTMGWCLDCHRSMEIAAPNDRIKDTGANCSACHF